MTLPGNAGIPGVTVSGREQGFCVKAVRDPAGLAVMPSAGIGKPCPGVRRNEQYIRTFANNACIAWSSSENNSNNAWNQNFSDGRQNNNNKNNTNSVQAVRGFTQNRLQAALRGRLCDPVRAACFFIFYKGKSRNAA
jgi:hypothetical protein